MRKWGNARKILRTFVYRSRYTTGSETSQTRVRHITSTATWVERHATFGPRIAYKAEKRESKKWTNIVTQHNISIQVPRWLLRFIFPGNIYICRGGRYPWVVSALRRFGWGGVERRGHINTLEGVSFPDWLWGLNTLSPETQTIRSFGAALHTEVKLWRSRGTIYTEREQRGVLQMLSELPCTLYGLDIHLLHIQIAVVNITNNRLIT